MISFFDILRNNGFDPNDFKLVRHGNAEIQVLDTYRENIQKFEAYQSFQAKKKFGESKHIAVFAPGRGTTAIFLGVWDIVASIQSENYTNDLHSIIDKFHFPENWHSNNQWYKLIRNEAMRIYSERLIVDWGKATVAWVQNKDKDVIELKAHVPNEQFYSYDKIQLKYYTMEAIINNPEANKDWYTALSSVNGIYLIRDIKSGKLYIGSAYGENGIWGRWRTYAQNGNGGNLELMNIDPNNFEFSVLEIISSVISIDYVIERENRWKERLKTREFGLNSN